MPEVHHVPPELGAQFAHCLSKLSTQLAHFLSKLAAQFTHFLPKPSAQLRHLVPEDEHVLAGRERVFRSRNLDLDRLPPARLRRGHSGIFQDFERSGLHSHGIIVAA
jgi:hypothetical protein